MNRILNLLAICCTLVMIAGCDSSDKENPADDSNRNSLSANKSENSADDSNRNSLTANKSRADYYFDRAIDKMNARNLQEAITYWNKVIELDPTSKGAYFNRGVAHGKLGETEKAKLDYAKAKELGY